MKLIKQIFLFGVALLFTLALSELFVRTSHLASVSYMEFYKDIGRGNRRNLNYLYFNEGFGIGRFNRYRYIGEPNPPLKKDNTIRIILMGDSYIEAFHVFERDYFGNIAENILANKFPKKRFELLNFGHSGFDIADIYAYQKIFADKFNPDFILYMLSKNDLEPKYVDKLRPKTILVNDTLTISYNFEPSDIKIYEKTKFLTQNSCILNMLNNGRRIARETPILSILLDKIYTLYNPVHEKVITENNSKYLINSVTEKIVKSLDPQKIIFINRDIQELPREFQKLCFDNGYEYFDLSKKLNSMKEQGIDPFEWKVTKKRGHWNQFAHHIVGEEVAKIISKIIDYE